MEQFRKFGLEPAKVGAPTTPDELAQGEITISQKSAAAIVQVLKTPDSRAKPVEQVMQELRDNFPGIKDEQINAFIKEAGGR